MQAPGWTDEQLAKLQMTWEKASVINEFAAVAEVNRAIYLDEWGRMLRKPARQLVNWSDIPVAFLRLYLG